LKYLKHLHLSDKNALQHPKKEAELLLTHQRVSVYHTYVIDSLRHSKHPTLFCLSPDYQNEPAFDVTELDVVFADRATRFPDGDFLIGYFYSRASDEVKAKMEENLKTWIEVTQPRLAKEVLIRAIDAGLLNAGKLKLNAVA
jgi:hypothetical protein